MDDTTASKLVVPVAQLDADVNWIEPVGLLAVNNTAKMVLILIPPVPPIRLAVSPLKAKVAEQPVYTKVGSTALDPGSVVP
jgi:hypothetical protein